MIMIHCKLNSPFDIIILLLFRFLFFATWKQIVSLNVFHHDNFDTLPEKRSLNVTGSYIYFKTLRRHFCAFRNLLLLLFSSLTSEMHFWLYSLLFLSFFSNPLSFLHLKDFQFISRSDFFFLFRLFISIFLFPLSPTLRNKRLFFKYFAFLYYFIFF